MHKHIKFLECLSIENEDSFQYILEMVNSVNKGDVIYICFENIDVLDSKNIPLLILLTYLLSKVVSQSIYIKADQKILDYLFSIDFFKLSYVRAKNLKCNKKEYNQVVIPIKKFIGTKGRSDLLQLARIKWNKHKEIMHLVYGILNDLSDNCLEHTGHDPEKVDCFAFAEQTTSFIKVIVMDFGEGFYESFQRRQEIDDEQDEENILVSVLEKHCSSRGDIGTGIWTVENIVNKRKGKLLVITGNSLTHYEKGKVQKIKNIPFISGSILYVEIDRN